MTYMTYEVWRVAKPNQTLFKTERIAGGYDNEEDADWFAHFEYMDDPAPDKSDFYWLEVRSVE